MSELRALIATLREFAHTCPQCAKHAFEVIEARDYRKQVARAASRDRHDRDWTTKLAHEADDLAERVRRANEHLDEPHEEPEERPAKPVRTRKVKADDGKVICPTCGGRAMPRSENPNQIGAHRSPWGQRCTRRLLKVEIEAPPVSLPPSRPIAATPDRVVTGSCHTCGKWIPGERRYCGQCLRKRGSM